MIRQHFWNLLQGEAPCPDAIQTRKFIVEHLTALKSLRKNIIVFVVIYHRKQVLRTLLRCYQS
jgi:hypothetical protein